VTLVLESAIRQTDIEAATLYEPTEEELVNEEDIDFSLETIYSYARHYEKLHPEERSDWTCLPLHEPESAALTNSYIAYTDHELHGEIIIYSAGDEFDYVSVDEFVSMQLARRLRYWHPDYIPDPYPEYYESPLNDREEPVQRIDPERFFDDLREYVIAERDSIREERRTEMAKKDPERIYREGGDAIPCLRSQGGSTQNTFTFTIETDRIEGIDQKATRRRRFVSSTFGIYSGDDVLLVPPNTEVTPDAFPVVATVKELGNTRVKVTIHWDDGADRRSVRSHLRRERVGFGLVKLLNPLPYDRRLNAIERLRKDETFRDVLTGGQALTFTSPLAAQSDPHDKELNQEQQSAVKHALMADALFCIHGPPGTGKTRTLVEIVRRAVGTDQDVLVCADSNQAVDNIVVGESTHETPDPGSLHAYGQHAAREFTLERRNVERSNRETIKEWYGDAPGGAEVVAATNGSAATINRQFDLVVIDEATQATCATTAIPLTKAETVILAGDHKQLPPFTRTESPPDSAYGLSLFEHLYGDGGMFEDVGIQLRTQYRMHRDIAYFPNKEFYDRSLRTGINVPTLSEWPPILGYDIGGSTETVGTSKANPTEAELINHLVQDLLSSDVTASDIGVITPYAAQAQRIRDRLSEQIPNGDAITVDTVDAFQGSERTVVLISFVRSNADGRIGFLGRSADGPRRLNVAITRAQQLCILIGDWQTLQTAPSQAHHCTDLYRDLYSYLVDTGRMREMDPALL